MKRRSLPHLTRPSALCNLDLQLDLKWDQFNPKDPTFDVSTRIKPAVLLATFPADAVLIHSALICSSSYLHQTLLLPARRAGRSLAAVRPLVDSCHDDQQRSGSGSDQCMLPRFQKQESVSGIIRVNKCKGRLHFWADNMT